MKYNNTFLNKIMPFILILLIIFLPLLKMESGSDSRIVFGYHLLLGVLDANGYPILITSWISMLFIFLPITIFIISQYKKNYIGKNIINFIVSAISFIYYLLLPLNAYKLLGSSYSGIYEFDSYFGYIILVLVLAIYMLSFLVVSIIEIRKLKKEENENIGVEDKITINKGGD